MHVPVQSLTFESNVLEAFSSLGQGIMVHLDTVYCLVWTPDLDDLILACRSNEAAIG